MASRAVELQAAAETASQEARDILIELRADTNDRTLAQQLRHLTEDLRSGGLDVIDLLKLESVEPERPPGDAETENDSETEERQTADA